MNFFFNLIIFFILQLIICNLIAIFFQSNPIYSLLFLISTFLNFSIFLLVVGIEFIALLFLIIYVGAISILFIFILMMLNVKYLEINILKDYNIISFFFIFLLFTAEFIIFWSSDFLFFEFYIIEFSYINWIDIYFSKSELESIGFVLYNFHFIDFLLSGIILLAVMISCIVLVISQNKISKSQFLFSQLSSSNKLLLKI